jgi:hypothetical protein
MKNYGISVLVALVVSLGVFFAVPKFTDFGKSVKIEHVSGTPAQGALYTADENGNMIPVDFTQLAEKAWMLWYILNQPKYSNIPIAIILTSIVNCPTHLKSFSVG